MLFLVWISQKNDSNKKKNVKKIEPQFSNICIAITLKHKGMTLRSCQSYLIVTHRNIFSHCSTSSYILCSWFQTLYLQTHLQNHCCWLCIYCIIQSWSWLKMKAEGFHCFEMLPFVFESQITFLYPYLQRVSPFLSDTWCLNSNTSVIFFIEMLVVVEIFLTSRPGTTKKTFVS